eukprot:TRINITY_DN3067_c0_g1_i1.p1 TRINITY_DN3067_c0_g1~~TRINITY_DN3067_c0_g1_i1.p1  ORF type:complete len:1111 (-),score=352.93 TRINITY_DN3067_c0_g1_i1:19-3351(-)
MEVDTDLSQSYVTHRAIKVMIVPIGYIPQHKFNYYVNIIKSQAIINFEDLSSLDVYSGALPNRNWKDAKIHVNFEVKTARKKDSNIDEWAPMQCHRRILGVIGVVLCSQFPDLSDAQEEFVRETQLHGGSSTFITSKCFAFEPMAEQPDLDRGNMIMIPNQNASSLDFYIKSQVHDLIGSILKAMELWATGNKSSPEESGQFITTVADTDNTADGMVRLKKRKQGRLSKCKGDWCLLAGSPVDAIYHYNAAIEQARMYDDSIWLGGALEGYVASALAIGVVPNHVDTNGDNNNAVQAVDSGEQFTEADVIDKATQSIQQYNKSRVLNLQVEAEIKLARMYIELQRRQEANDILMDVYDVVDGFSVSSKISVTSTIAMLYRQMKYMRKYAFFIRETAVLYHKKGNPHAAHSLMKLIAKHYQLEELDDSRSLIAKRTGSRHTEQSVYNPNSKRNLKDRTTRDWLYLQRIMLQNLLKTSKGIMDSHSIVKHCISLLKTQYEGLTDTWQQQYASELAVNSLTIPSVGYDSLEINMIGFPQVKKIVPMGVPDRLNPQPNSTGEEKAHFTWLYSPYVRRGVKQKAIVWVVGETAQVKVEIANLTAVDLEIQSMELSTYGAKFEPYKLSCIIPGRSSSVEVILTGKPLDASGSTLYIKGVIIKCFNLSCEHPVNMQGIGVSVKEYEYFTKFPPRGLKSIANQVTIAPPMPLLFVKEKTMSGGHIKLIEGERYECTISIQNCGAYVIDKIEMTLVEKFSNHREPQPHVYELSDPERVFQWDTMSISRHLPLLPGQHIDIPIFILGKLSSAGGEFNFKYSSSECPDFHRVTTLGIPLKIQGGLEVVSFDILSSVSESNDSYFKDNEALIVFEVVNPSDHSFRLTSSVKDAEKEHAVYSFTLETHTVKRLIIPIRKFTLKESEIPPVPPLRFQYLRPTKELTEEQKFQQRMQYWYKNEILKRLHMSWVCSTLNTVGTLQLMHKMTVSERMTECLKLDMVQITMRLGVPSEDRFFQHVNIRKQTSLELRVKNLTSNVASFKLLLQPFYDFENGTRETEIHGKIAWFGKLGTNLPELGVGEERMTEIPLMFMVPGVYKFLAACEDVTNGQVTRGPYLSISAE